MLRKRTSITHAQNVLHPAQNNMIKESTCTCNTQNVKEYDYKICEGYVIQCVSDNGGCPSELEDICSSHGLCPSNCSCDTVAKCIAEVVTCASVCKPQTAAYYYYAYGPSNTSWGGSRANIFTCLSN